MLFTCKNFMFSDFTKEKRFFAPEMILKNVIHQIDSKNGWLLLPASFAAKFGLVFVLTLAFSWGFHFQANRKSTGSSKKQC